MPSASSTSADPHCDVAARLPCFTTRAPTPAATSAAIVDTLTVHARSPPVPHVSIAPSATVIVVANRNIVRTIAASSVTVSPFVLSATAKPAASMSDARPSRISAKATSISAASRSVPRTSFASTGVMSSFTSVPPQVVIEHTLGDEPELDLRRALHDRQLLRVPVPELGRMVLHVPRGTEHLQG